MTTTSLSQSGNRAAWAALSLDSFASAFPDDPNAGDGKSIGFVSRFPDLNNPE